MTKIEKKDFDERVSYLQRNGYDGESGILEKMFEVQSDIGKVLCDIRDSQAEIAYEMKRFNDAAIDGNTVYISHMEVK